MPRETSPSCIVIEGCLPTWESDPVATEAVAPILYPLALWHPCTLAPWHPGTLAPWLHPGTHQQAQRLLRHPLQLGSPPLIGPHTSVSILEPAHLFRSDGFAVLRNNLCWRAGVLRPLWWTPGNWTKQRARWYRTHTPLRGRRFGLSSLKEPDRGDNKTLVMTHMSGATQFNRVKEEHTGCFLFLYEDKES